MPTLLRIAPALFLALCLSGCSSDPDEVALQDACEALTNADWAALDVAVDEVSTEGEDEFGLDDFYAVVDGSRAEEFARGNDDNVSSLELMGRDGAVNHVRSGFEGAWDTCTEEFDDTPPADGSDFTAAWDDLGVGLFYLFGVE